MQPLLISHKDYGDGLKWWNMAYGAGYPDWLVRSPLPVDGKEEDERWVWTGRMFVPLPKDLYEPWLLAHSQPVSLERLWEMFRPYADGHDAEAVRLVLKSGLFVTWPWGLQDLDDTPDAVGLQANPVSKPANPLPEVIPNDEWSGVIRMDRLVEMWQDGREREALPGGLYDTVQDLLRSKVAWLIAQPVPGLRA